MGGAQSNSAECEKLARRLPQRKKNLAEDSFKAICDSQGKIGLGEYKAHVKEIGDRIQDIVFQKLLCYSNAKDERVDWYGYLKFCVSFEQSPDAVIFDVFDINNGTFLKEILPFGEPFISCLNESLLLLQTDDVFMIRNDLKQQICFKKILPCVYHACKEILDPFKIHYTLRVPALDYLDGCRDLSILEEAQAWFLYNCNIMQAHKTWHQIYNSDKQGKAWATMMSAIIGRSNTLFLVKDTNSHIFGAFAPCVWMKSAGFYGKEDGHGSAIFCLSPSARLYAASGYNTNFQYLASGCTSGINPNGIGLGGQVKHFGFFVDSSLDSGHSYPSATFNNTSLSESEKFEIDVVEIWAGPEMADDGTAKKTGVLRNPKFQADKKILEFAGVYQDHPRSR